MTAFKKFFRKTCFTLIVIGSVWCLLAPAPTWAAEDQYKIPGWACKPAGLKGSPSFLHAKYHQQKGHIYNAHTAAKIDVICPLHVKKEATDIKKVLVYYTNNNPRSTVSCTLQVRGSRGNASKFGRSPSGPKQGFISLTNRHLKGESMYFLACRIPWRTTTSFSSIDNIHVYQSKPEDSSCSPPFCFDPGGVSTGSIMPGVACDPTSENRRTKYSHHSSTGALENLHPTRPLQVVCPIVRDNMKTTKSPYVVVDFENQNPSNRFRASCTLQITSPTQGTKHRMRWVDPDSDGMGIFKTTRKFEIKPYDTYSILCSIPPRAANGKTSGIRMMTFRE